MCCLVPTRPYTFFSFTVGVFLAYDNVWPRSCPHLPIRVSLWLRNHQRLGLNSAEAMLGCCQKISGPNKTVEIDDRKFGRRKYNRKHTLKGQGVFGGVEHEFGRIFLLPSLDRTANTLLAVLREWIEAGTAVISDCWSAYWHQETRGYTNQTGNHTIGFVYVRTRSQTNTIESTWRHVHAFFNTCNRMADYVYHLAHYIFVAGYLSDNVDHFTNLICIVASIDWSSTPPLHPGHVAMSVAVAPFPTSLLSLHTKGRIVAFTAP